MCSLHNANVMLKCKRCGEIFPGIYLSEDNKVDPVSKMTKFGIPHFVRGATKINMHQKIIWIGLRPNKLV